MMEKRLISKLTGAMTKKTLKSFLMNMSEQISFLEMQLMYSFLRCQAILLRLPFTESLAR
jgi:hypothetical protein